MVPCGHRIYLNDYIYQRHSPWVDFAILGYCVGTAEIGSGGIAVDKSDSAALFAVISLGLGVQIQEALLGEIVDRSCTPASYSQAVGVA